MTGNRVMRQTEHPRISVVGAGSIGCYVGGLLASVGVDVTFCGRERIGVELAQHGLALELLDGSIARIEGTSIQYVTDVQDLPAADIILVCVKSDDSAEVAQQIAQLENANAVIISLQNGLDNVFEISRHLSGDSIVPATVPATVVVPGMVAFNVVQKSPGHYACATEGALYLGVGQHSPTLVAMLEKAGIQAHVRDDMEAVQYTKLMLNLNNALNVLSGLSLAEQLRDRRWRRLMAACIDEGLAVAKAMGLKPTRVGKVRPSIIPLVLRLPNFLFLRVAAQMMKVDPSARTSMYDDLEKGRRPEIDHLNGKIVTLGVEHSVPTPVNAKIVKAIRDLFDGTRTQNKNPAGLLYTKHRNH